MTIEKQKITIQLGLAVVVVIAVVGGTWSSAIHYERMNSGQGAMDSRLKAVETKVAALQASSHDVDVALAEIQKDLKYLVLMVEEKKGEK